ncbi:hypothetical protein CsSME_00008095 [Camellia sinensis var. sinensis]
MAETLITPNSHPDESSDPPAPPSIESLFSRKSISTQRRSHSLGSAMAVEGFGWRLTEARCVGPGQWSIGSGWEETRWVGVFGCWVGS